MRLNKYIAQSTGISRRAADAAIAAGSVQVNGEPAVAGHIVTGQDQVTLDGKVIDQPQLHHTTIMLNKPVGYICSRDGQGGQTIYDLLPRKLHHLKPVGRLDKQSSGLLIMTTDGQLAFELTHPKFNKSKTYKIALSMPLGEDDLRHVKRGVALDDGPSKLELTPINPDDHNNWKVVMSEGRNRQIRRTFEALGYHVVKLHRTHFGPYTLRDLRVGKHSLVTGDN